MKRILLRLAFIGLLLAAVVPATGAWFTAQASSTNNSVTAGKINLMVNGVLWSTQSQVGPVMTVAYIEPGKWFANVGDSVNSGDPGYNLLSSTLTVLNPGNADSLHFKYKLSAAGVSETVGGYYNLLWVRVYRAEGSSTHFVKKWEGLLKDMVVDPSVVSVMGDLAPNNSHDWKFDIGLDSTAGNAYQGANATFNIVVDATQTINPGWTP